MKRNCINCKHLEYFNDGYEGPQPGYYCNNRDYVNRRKERKHLDQLQDEKYLKQQKKCCEVKP